MPADDLRDAIPFEQAPSMALERLGGRPTPWIVGVTGPVGSGKSTLADRLIGANGGGIRLSTDDFLPDYAEVPEPRRDHPDESDLDGLARVLASLARGEVVDAPVWSFHEHKRTGVRRIEPAELVVCEGIHALHKKVRGLMGLLVFVHASPATRWGRWERIESEGERGWGVEKAKRYFEGVADPTFELFADEYRDAAHLTVHNDHNGGTS